VRLVDILAFHPLILSPKKAEASFGVSDPEGMNSGKRYKLSGA
jgi:hypothetical protein